MVSEPAEETELGSELGKEVEDMVSEPVKEVGVGSEPGEQEEDMLSEPVEEMEEGLEPGKVEEEEEDRKWVGQMEESREGLVLSTDLGSMGYWEQLDEQSVESGLHEELWE